MFLPLFKTRLEWRRAAIYQPVRVAGGTLVNKDGADRQRILQTCRVGTHVLLRREPTSRAPNGVAVFVSDGRRIGHLPGDVAEWLAPLLDSDKMTFDAEIWSLEKVADEQGDEMIICQLMLTQFELVPVKRFTLTAWLRRARRPRSKVAAK